MFSLPSQTFLFNGAGVCFSNSVVFLPGGPSYHPPQFGSEGGRLPALHPAAALCQRRLLHQGVCSSLHRPGHGEELSQVGTPVLVSVGGLCSPTRFTKTCWCSAANRLWFTTALAAALSTFSGWGAEPTMENSKRLVNTEMPCKWRQADRDVVKAM